MRDGAAIAKALGGHSYAKGWMFRCPCHDDRVPSASIRFDGLVTCFAGCPREKVKAALDALGFIDNDSRRKPLSRAERQAYITEAICEAQRMWEDAGPAPWESEEVRQRRFARIRETVAAFLRWRGVTLPAPPVLRHWPINGRICAVQRADGVVTAVQVHHAFYSGCRKTTYGHMGDGAVRLTEPTGDELGLAEGVVTALSATQMFGVPCWATLGSKRLDAVQLPSGINRVHIFADNDDPGREGAQNAVARYCRRECRHVTVHWPDEPFKDWNDVLKPEQMRAKK